MEIGQYLIIGWIILVLVVWIFIRIKKPNLFGLTKNINEQRLDKVRLEVCSVCKKGVLEPKFAWWRYFFGIGIPPIFYVVGSPNEYRCTNCNQVVHHFKKGIITRISLAHKLPIIVIIAQIIFFVTMAILVVLSASKF